MWVQGGVVTPPSASPPVVTMGALLVTEGSLPSVWVVVSPAGGATWVFVLTPGSLLKNCLILRFLWNLSNSARMSPSFILFCVGQNLRPFSRSVISDLESFLVDRFTTLVLALSLYGLLTTERTTEHG